MDSSKYGYGVMLPGKNHETAIAEITAALGEQGFGVLTSIDVKATLKKKLEADFRPYTILGACNPKLAHRALGIDGQIGLLLPCNVVVQDEGDGSRVSVINPRAMFSVVDADGFEDIVDEVDKRLRAALDAVSSAG